MFTNRHMRRHPEFYGITFVNDHDDDEAGGGGSNVAVLDREDADESDDSDGDTDDDGDESDPDADGGDKSRDTNADNGKVLDDETEALFQARLAEDRQNRDREAAAEREREDEEQAQQAHTQKLASLYSDSEKALTGILDGIGVEIEGQVYRLDKPTRDAILKNLTDFNDGVGGAADLRHREVLTRNLLALAPEDGRDALAKALAKPDMSYGDFLKAGAEALAKNTNAVKAMGLDELIELSPKAKREHIERVKAARAGGRTLGQNDPDADPSLSGQAPAKPLTFEQLQAGYAAGTLTDAQDAEYSRLKAERDKAR